mmetsp:Transcript_83974/g.224656  ORF Transcript_83974/g.224656 Transcript_83974/m.224656 type:complete len:487 (-) Transcript_83974:938-2398(-)
MACIYGVSQLIFLQNHPVSRYLQDLDPIRVPKVYTRWVPETAKLRVMVILGTRPEAIKLAPVINALWESNLIQCVTVSTGQHREMLHQVLSLFKLENKIDFDLDIMSVNQSLTRISASVLQHMSSLLDTVDPHLVLVQGDTTTAFMAALAAFYRRVPIGHIEAGLRTFNKYSPFPEEINRQGISAIATMHFAPTKMAARNLQISGLRFQNVFLTGNTVVDALYSVLNVTKSRRFLDLVKRAHSLAGGVANILLLTAHRRENHGKPLLSILRAVKRLLETFRSVVVIFPVHLNPNVQMAVLQVFPIEVRGLPPLNRIIFTDPLDYGDLVHVMNASHHVLTDSGGIQEEVTALGKPVLVLRTSTERMEAVVAGVAELVGANEDAIFSASSRLLSDSVTHWARSRASPIYGNGTSARQIVNVIEGRVGPLLARDNSGEQTVGVYSQEGYEWVVVLTVWKRNTLARQLLLLERQVFGARKPKMKVRLGRK